MGVENWQPREGGYSYAYQLIKQIREMNAGTFLKREGYSVEQREKTDFCIGAAVYPEHPDPQERLDFAKIKFTEGAEYGITQMIFDPEIYARFMESLRKAGVDAPIIPGVRILKSKKQAAIMESRFGCKVPKWYVEKLPETSAKGEVNPEVLQPFAAAGERGATDVELEVDLRYAGQAYELRLADGARLAERFHRAHAELYGYALDDRPIEVVCVRARVSSRARRTDVAARRPRRRAAPAAARVGERRAHFGDWTPTGVWNREALAPGHVVDGPALIEEFSGTTLVPPGWRARVVRGGHLVLESSG